MKSLQTFRGKIVSGKNRGKQLGFPTANVPLHKKIPEGIYASQITIDQTIFNAVTFIGSAKTFDEKDYKSETYIFDFDQDIYDKRVTVKLFKKIRGNKKFDTEKELVKQMEKDVEEVKDLFKD